MAVIIVVVVVGGVKTGGGGGGSETAGLRQTWVVVAERQPLLISKLMVDGSR